MSNDPISVIKSWLAGEQKMNTSVRSAIICLVHRDQQQATTPTPTSRAGRGMMSRDWTADLRLAQEAVNRARSGDLESRLQAIGEAKRLLDVAEKAIREDME